MTFGPRVTSQPPVAHNMPRRASFRRQSNRIGSEARNAQNATRIARNELERSLELRCPVVAQTAAKTSQFLATKVSQVSPITCILRVEAGQQRCKTVIIPVF